MFYRNFLQLNNNNNNNNNNDNNNSNNDDDDNDNKNTKHISFHATSLFVNCLIILVRVNTIEVTPLRKVEMVTIKKAISYNFEVG